jgi:hypothetical protein
MSEIVQALPRRTARKARLFAAACCRRLLLRMAPHPRDLEAIDAAERFADGEATAAELQQAARRRTRGSPCSL